MPCFSAANKKLRATCVVVEGVGVTASCKPHNGGLESSATEAWGHNMETRTTTYVNLDDDGHGARK